MSVHTIHHEYECVYLQHIHMHTLYYANTHARTHTAVLDTVDYVLPDGMCVFRTCHEETDRLIFQMVSCSSNHTSLA